MCTAGATAALDAAAAARSATEGSCSMADTAGTNATDEQLAERRGSHAQASAGPGADAAPSSGAGARHVPKSTADGYFTDFKLCLSSPELTKLLVKHGHQRPLIMDATHGTNNLKAWLPSPSLNCIPRHVTNLSTRFACTQQPWKMPASDNLHLSWLSLQFHLYTAMVMDDQQNGIPVAWYLTNRSCTTSVETFLTSVLDAARKLQPDFQFGSVHCDDAADELAAIRWVPSV